MSHRSGSRRRRVGSVLVLSAALTASGVAIATPVDAAPVLPAAPGSVIGLQYGDYGPEVRLLQEALIRVGVGVVHGVDGYFGSAQGSAPIISVMSTERRLVRVGEDQVTP